jgi:hypothetical protein
LIEAPTPPKESEVVERRTEIVISSGGDEGSHGSRDRDDGGRSDKGGRGHSSKASHEQSRSRTEKRSLSPIEIIRKPSRSRRRSHSTAAHKEYDEEEFKPAHGAVAIIAPRDHHHKDERTIQAEIRALEAEKRALKYEREMEKEHRKADRLRDGEIIIERDRDVIKIEKDRKGRMSLVR